MLVVAAPSDIHPHKANVIGKIVPVGEVPDFAKKFRNQICCGQVNALLHSGNQAVPTVDFLVGRLHFEQPVGKEHNEIVCGHWALASLVLSILKQSERRSTAAVGAY